MQRSWIIHLELAYSPQLGDGLDYESAILLFLRTYLHQRTYHITFHRRHKSNIWRELCDILFAQNSSVTWEWMIHAGSIITLTHLCTFEVSGLLNQSWRVKLPGPSSQCPPSSPLLCRSPPDSHRFLTTLHFCGSTSLAAVQQGQMPFHFLAFDRCSAVSSISLCPLPPSLSLPPPFTPTLMLPSLLFLAFRQWL